MVSREVAAISQLIHLACPNLSERKLILDHVPQKTAAFLQYWKIFLSSIWNKVLQLLHYTLWEENVVDDPVDSRVQVFYRL